MDKDLIERYQLLADSEREEGGKVFIHFGIPYISLTTSAGQQYFFQGEEAQNLLDQCPEEIHEQDYLLASAVDW